MDVVSRLKIVNGYQPEKVGEEVCSYTHCPDQKVKIVRAFHERVKRIGATYVFSPEVCYLKLGSRMYSEHFFHGSFLVITGVDCAVVAVSKRCRWCGST